MPRRCTVCAHEMREIIDTLLIEGKTPKRRIATQFGLNEGSIRWHEKHHLSEDLVKSHKALQIAQSDNLLDKIIYLQREALEILQESRDNKENHTALNAIGRTAQLIELQGELLGKLDRAPVQMIINSPVWIQLQQVILEATKDAPDIRKRIAEHFSALAKHSRVA